MRQENNLRKKIEDYSYGLADVLADNLASKVYKGIKENTKETVAIKVIDIKGFKNKQDKKALEMEIDVLRKVHHSNILRCLDVYSTFNNCYIITEYCDGGDLKALLDQKKTKFSFSQAISIFKDIYKGYKNLFQNGYIHRNLDPSNILIRDGEYKLSDFGMASKELDLPTKVDDYIGVSPYRSPEALKNQTIGPKCDIWALGVILYQLLQNKLPFQNYDSKFAHKTIPDYGDIPSNAKQFIEKCFLTNSLRVTFSELQSHPFIIQILSSPTVPSIVNRQDYCSVPMTRVASKIQNKHPSELDKIKDQRKNKGQIVAKSLIGLMRFIFRLQQLLPESKLHYLALKQLLTILECFKKSINLQNPFQCSYLRDFFCTEKSRKVVEVIQSYIKKYSHLNQQFQKYIIKGTKDRKFLPLLDNNLTNNEGLVLATIPYTVQFIKSNIKQLKYNPTLQKLEDKETLPKQLQSVALRIDYAITFYQLNCLRITDWADYLLFVDQSRIDQILEYPPSQMQKMHIKSIQKKIIELQI